MCVLVLTLSTQTALLHLEMEEELLLKYFQNESKSLPADRVVVQWY